MIINKIKLTMFYLNSRQKFKILINLKNLIKRIG